MDQQRRPNTISVGRLDLAYASSEQTLDDYLKSDICKGRDIYCAFEPEGVATNYYREWLEKEMIRIGIKSISFKNQHVIQNQSTKNPKIS